MKNINLIIKKEGDFYEWTYIAMNGLEVDCFIRRNDVLALCGYVVITRDNSLFGLEYDDISEKSNFEALTKEINQYTWLEKKDEN